MMFVYFINVKFCFIPSFRFITFYFIGTDVIVQFISGTSESIAVLMQR